MSAGAKLVRPEKPATVSEQEAEARLRQEGYEVFRWHDVPGSSYPRHRHEYDECLWVLEGEMSFTVDGTDFTIISGDRLYIPAKTPHTAIVPGKKGCTYLVGQKR